MFANTIRPADRSRRALRRAAVAFTFVAASAFVGPAAGARCATRDGRPASCTATRAASAPSVLLIGDSNIFGSLGQSLARRLRARGMRVERFGKPASGLSRPDFFDWPREGARLVAATDPDIVIFMVGGNDHQRLEAPGGSGTRIRWREMDRWREEYGRRAIEVADLLHRGGRRVFFLSPTNRAPRIDREDAYRVSRIQEAALAGLDDVTWVDMFALTTDRHGHWLDRGVGADGRWHSYRRPDGIHLTDEGGELVAEGLLAILDARGLLECAEVLAVTQAASRGGTTATR